MLACWVRLACPGEVLVLRRVCSPSCAWRLGVLSSECFGFKVLGFGNLQVPSHFPFLCLACWGTRLILHHSPRCSPTSVTMRPDGYKRAQHAGHGAVGRLSVSTRDLGGWIRELDESIRKVVFLGGS